MSSELTDAMAWGSVSGLRSMLGPALLSRRLRDGAARLTPMQKRLASPAVSHALEVLALGEVIADKTPFIPSRLSPAALAGRALSGAWVGSSAASLGSVTETEHPSVAGVQPAKNALLAAAAGASAAVGAAFVGYHVRRFLGQRFGLSTVASGLLEDAFAVWGASRIGRRRAPAATPPR